MSTAPKTAKVDSIEEFKKSISTAVANLCVDDLTALLANKPDALHYDYSESEELFAHVICPSDENYADRRPAVLECLRILLADPVFSTPSLFDLLYDERELMDIIQVCFDAPADRNLEEEITRELPDAIVNGNGALVRFIVEQASFNMNAVLPGGHPHIPMRTLHKALLYHVNWKDGAEYFKTIVPTMLEDKTLDTDLRVYKNDKWMTALGVADYAVSTVKDESDEIRAMASRNMKLLLDRKDVDIHTMGDEHEITWRPMSEYDKSSRHLPTRVEED